MRIIIIIIIIIIVVVVIISIWPYSRMRHIVFRSLSDNIVVIYGRYLFIIWLWVILTRKPFLGVHAVTHFVQ